MPVHRPMKWISVPAIPKAVFAKANPCSDGLYEVATPILKVAVQVLGASMVMVVLGFEPEQSPLQPQKPELASAVAVRVTGVL